MVLQFQTCDDLPSQYDTTMRFSPRFGVQIGICCLFAVLAAGFRPVSLSAHALLEATSPISGSALGSMPGTIELRFTEPIDVDSVRIDLQAPDGSTIPVTNLTIDDGGKVVRFNATQPASVGVLSLAWRVTSATDGHDSSGSVFFSVGTGRAPPAATDDSSNRSPWWQILLRALWLCSLGVIAAGIPGTLPHQRVILPMAGVVIFAAALASPAMSFQIGDLTTSGRLTLASGLLGLIAALATVAGAGRGTTRAVAALAWLGAVSLLVASGHAAGVDGRLTAIAAATVHTALALLWLAAVLRLALIRPSGTTVSQGNRLTRVAVLGLFAIGATGLATAAIHLPDQRSVTSTTYGVSLAIKVALVVLVLAIAATNRWVTAPWVRQHDNAIDRQAYWMWTAEAVALMAVIVTAAVLSNTAPPPSRGVVQAAAPVATTSRSAVVDDLTVVLDAEFTGSPDDVVFITVTGPEGAPADGVAGLTVETTATTAAGQLAEDRFDASPLGADTGRFAFPTLRLGATAVWNMAVTVHRPGVREAVVRFTVDTTGWVVPTPSIESRSWRLPIVPAGAWALLGLAAAIAIGGALVVLRQRGVAPVSGAIIFLALAMIATGFAIQAAQRTAPRTSGHNLEAPADANLVTAAADYEALCLACHGAAGGGLDTIDPNHQHGSGTDIIDERSGRLSDGDLYTLISDGIPGTDMPSYGSALTESRRWDLVSYLRTLQSANPATPTPQP